MSASAATVALPRVSGARSAWRRLARYIVRHPVYYGVWTAVTLAYTAGFVAVGRLVGWAVEGVAKGLPHAEVSRRVVWLVAVIAGSAVLRFYSRTLVFNAAREIEYELRNDLFAQLLRLPQSFYGRWRTGDIMSRCVNDTNAVRLLMGVAVLNILQTPVLYVAVVATMLARNARLALFVLLPYPLFILVARAIGRRVHHWSLLTQEGLGEASNQLQEVISGIAVVKAYAMEGVTRRRFDQVNDALWQRQLGLVRTNAAMPGITLLLPALAVSLILVIGGGDIVAGRMEVADFFTFSFYVFQLAFPTFIMGWVVALVQRGAASMQRIDELLSVTPSIAEPRDPVPISALRGEIEFRHLDFRYDSSDAREPALRDVSLRVPAGTTLGVVGSVGAGKTTLASLIPRLFEVEDGKVFVDGVDINRLPLATLRRHIAMVPQDSFLFSATLAQNIAFGRPDAPRAEIERAAQRAQLAKDVADLPNGYDTLVGERGVMLSGGQRQRTALARALILEPSILVLDDTLSAVDAETEAAIQRELDAVFRGRTVVVVSSRVSAVRGADQIVVLHDGRIVERGRHEELLRAGGLYARLSREQAAEQGAAEELALAGAGS
ncbi:MAG TPA: ABC transporter ATP-binding protein [Myxococcota bacterium]|nr:ABC transporter ATP-binding protein [Myxococcota bacterium]